MNNMVYPYKRPFYILIFYFIGHAHITDFNIAATLHGKKLASSLSGTKPYIGMYKILYVYPFFHNLCYYFVVFNLY